MGDVPEKMSFWKPTPIILLQPIYGHVQTTTAHQILTTMQAMVPLFLQKTFLTMDIML